MSKFPRQDVPLSQKTPAWMSLHLDYAEQLVKGNKDGRLIMNDLFDSFNGIKPQKSLLWLERRYGKKNVASFQTFKYGRTKLNLLHGEFLKRPLSSTVTTIDSAAMSDKMAQQDMLVGAVIAKKALTDIKDKAGVDVLEGAEIPETIDEVFAKMSPKDKQETIMQIILDNQIPELDAKKKLSDCFLHMLITSMCYIKVEIDDEGEVELHVINPMDAIYEAIEGDDYLDKSPIKGCRQTLSVNEILRRYKLSDEQRNMLEAARANPGDYIQRSHGQMRDSGGQLVCDVIHIEWLSCDPIYWKKSPYTKSQKQLDPTKDFVTLEMDAKSYEENYDIHAKKIEKGEYQVETTWHQCRYEATRIGGLIDVNMRKKNFQPIDIDKPSYVMDSTYHGFICGTVNGERISMQQMIYNLDVMLDIVMYQQNKDIARAKGKALFFDRAGLSAGQTAKTVMYSLTNEGYMDYNSAADGNISGQKINDLANAIKEIDLGLSASFQYLNDFKQSLIADMDKITGINDNREGQIQASSTVSNANSAIQASRTITEPLFYGMNGFVQRVMQSIVDVSAISWAFYKTEKGEQILGSQKFGYLQVSKEMGWRNYGVHIEDGSKFGEMKQYAKEMLSISLNAKEIRPMDAYKVLMSETMAQMNTSLLNSWQAMQAAVEKSNAEGNRVKMQIEEMRMKQQLQIADADREDRQTNEKDNIVLAADQQIRIDDNKGKNKMAENQHKIVNENIFSNNE